MTSKSEPSNRDVSSPDTGASSAFVPLAVAISVTIAVSILFLVLPSIDIGVSNQFFRAGTGFPATGNGLLRTLRSLGLLSINLSLSIVAALTLARCLLPVRWMPGLLTRLRPRSLIFLASTAMIGPGLIANVILKDHWGRARPIDTSLFGGAHPFSLPWVISDSCTRNCSFISGEGSGIFWLIAFGFVASKAIRMPLMIALLVWAAVISLNRIAFGGHYLSDVLIGWGLMLIVMLVLRDIVLLRYGDRIDRALTR